MKVEYVDKQTALENCVKEIKLQNEIAVDLEFDRNSFGYGFVLCLIQIAIKDSIYLIDPFSIKDIKVLNVVLSDESIFKIFHNASEDIILLKKQGFNIRNIWDTEKAAIILNYKKIGLMDMLSEVLNVKLNKEQQRTNWKKRPLHDKQLEYAVEDVRYLIQLKSILQKQLERVNLHSWILEEGKELENLEETEKESYLRIKGAKKLDPRMLGRLKSLSDWREKKAHKYDKPPYQIIPNDKMIELSKPSNKKNDWLKIKGVYPKLHDDKNYEEIKNLMQVSNPLRIEKPNNRRNQRLEEDLRVIKKHLQKTEGESRTKLILSQGIIREIIERNSLSHLKDYAQSKILSGADDLGINLKYLK